jgi:cation diffusion facilitator family transporter
MIRRGILGLAHIAEGPDAAWNSAMHSHSIDQFRHSHVFLGDAHERNERKMWLVIAICATMMTAEIFGGIWFGSVALIADGLHMSTHAGALLIAALAYTLARKHAASDRLTFGTGKLGDLAAFTSAVVLVMIALLIGYESITRFVNPVPIAFDEAIPIAVVGFGVNLLTAFLLREDGEHRHVHEHARRSAKRSSDHHERYRRDHNLRAAFLHVAADAAVSALVIIGLVAARQFGWYWLDPAMGLIATIVIVNWSWTLVLSAGAVLLDASPDPRLAHKIAARPHLGPAPLSRGPRPSCRDHFAGLGPSPQSKRV